MNVGKYACRVMVSTISFVVLSADELEAWLADAYKEKISIAVLFFS